MNRRLRPLFQALVIGLLALLWLQAAAALASPADNYDLSWFDISGGGDTSRGGAYTLSGSLGQPDAASGGVGALTGGRYALTGGFWFSDASSAPPQTLYVPLVQR